MDVQEKQWKDQKPATPLFLHLKNILQLQHFLETERMEALAYG